MSGSLRVRLVLIKSTFNIFKSKHPQVNAPATAATVKNLKPGHLYRFEVYAINKEGDSEPAQTDPVKAEAPYSKL